MQLKTFTINSTNAERSETDVNLFLRSHRILRVEHHFMEHDGGSWSILIEYQDEQPDAVSPVASRKKKDYTSDLNEAQKEKYEHLRKIRSQLSMQRSVPAYIIFTNEELSILAREKELTASSVKKIKGIAPSRLNDSISFFLDTSQDHEASGTPD